MKSKLVFNEDRHEYTVDGVVVPSVTQIIRFLSFDTAATASPAMRDAAAERGSRVHAACTAFDFDGDAAEIDGDIAGYVRAYASFLRDYSVKHFLRGTCCMRAARRSRVRLWTSTAKTSWWCCTRWELPQSIRSRRKNLRVSVCSYARNRTD